MAFFLADLKFLSFSLHLPLPPLAGKFFIINFEIKSTFK